MYTQTIPSPCINSSSSFSGSEGSSSVLLPGYSGSLRIAAGKEGLTSNQIIQNIQLGSSPGGYGQGILDEYTNLVYKSNPEKLEATYGRLVPVLVKAVQELSAEVKQLKQQLNN